MTFDPEIDRHARLAASYSIKSGRAAAACRFGYKAMAAGAPDPRHTFAICVVAYAAAELAGKAAGAELPRLRWFAPARPGEKADYGADEGPIDGLTEVASHEMWINASVPNRRLVEVVAHETCHAMRHRWNYDGNDIACEREATAFGLAVAEKWGVRACDHAVGDLVVAQSWGDWPEWTPGGSVAYVLDEMKVYSTVNGKSWDWRVREDFATPLDTF